jgi:hypothetical protein
MTPAMRACPGKSSATSLGSPAATPTDDTGGDPTPVPWGRHCCDSRTSKLTIAAIRC